jgi:hypothetical protein
MHSKAEQFGLTNRLSWEAPLVSELNLRATRGGRGVSSDSGMEKQLSAELNHFPSAPSNKYDVVNSIVPEGQRSDASRVLQPSREWERPQLTEAPVRAVTGSFDN